MRMLGHVLMWAGFLSASIACVSRKEVDLLPQAERDALAKLSSQARLTQFEMEQYTSTDLAEMSSDEFVRFIETISPTLNDRVARQAVLDELSSKTIAQLSSQQWEQLKTHFDELEQQAKAREAAEAEKTAGVKPPTQSAEALAVERKKSKSLSRYNLIDQRVVSLDNRWDSVPWLWFLASIGVGVGGVVLLRSTAKSAKLDMTRVESEYAIVTENMNQLQNVVGQLNQSLDKMAPLQIVDFIDDQCLETFSNVADARGALIQKFGLQAYADIMTPFASAERFVNRAWSAATDGYLNEARDCVERALGYLNTAIDLIAQHEKQSANSPLAR